jgi:hypothetical protein
MSALVRFTPIDLTSNTSHPPFVTSGSTFAAPHDAWMAFNGVANDPNAWIGSTAGTGYVQIDTGVSGSYVLTSYIVQAYDSTNSGRSPNAWTVQGSNDGSTWTTLDTRTAQTNWASLETRMFAVTGAAAWRYFKLNVTANNGDATYTEIGEIQFQQNGTGYGWKAATSGAFPRRTRVAHGTAAATGGGGGGAWAWVS